MTCNLAAIRSALYMPASNPRALEKAPSLGADMIVLDLEDAVPEEDKERARTAAVDAVARGFGDKVAAIRINGFGSIWHAKDIAIVRDSQADIVVVPKVEDGAAAAHLAEEVGKPLIAMIETPAGLYAARQIAMAEGVKGIFAGTNDIAAELRLPSDAGRGPLALSLQMIVMAAAAARIPAFDGVNNNLDDLEGLEAECREGRNLGFAGKTLIHPKQIAACNTAFSPSEREVEEAEALVEAATGGAERFRGRMIEAMHVSQAKLLLARASHSADRRDS